jgi:hypothetical protein
MGTHHGGNDGNPPPDGDHPRDPELPELPPEWGEISIPDDPSELAAEAEQIRAELAREREGGLPRRPAKPAGDPEPSIGVPLLIMSVAVLITLISLFAMTWSGSNPVTPAPGAEPEGPVAFPPVTLTDAIGQPVALAGQPPMAVLLVEECDCGSLITATVATAPPGVTVVAVGRTPPARPAGLRPGDPVPLLLGDPNGLLRARLDLGPPTNAATVVLVDGDGRVTRTHPAATSVVQYQGDLVELS